MTESFKQFLKNNTNWLVFCDTCQEYITDDENEHRGHKTRRTPEEISVKNLGEWAWKEIKEEFEFAKKEMKKAKGTDVESDAACEFYELMEREDIKILKKIAIACLGKKIIKKIKKM